MDNTYRPVFYLTRDECFMPMSFLDYMSGSNLVDQNCNVVIKSPVSSTALFNYAKANNGAANCTFQLVDRNMIFGDKNLYQVPVYTNTVKANGMTYINYSVFFGFNGFFIIPVLVENLCQGGHVADLEHVTLELDAKNNPTRMLYSRHGSAEIQWINWSDVPKENGRPVVYIARQGHGMYQGAGEWVRPETVGFANDFAEKYFKWDVYALTRLFTPSQSGFDLNTMGFMNYMGDLGQSMPDGAKIGCRNDQICDDGCMFEHAPGGGTCPYGLTHYRYLAVKNKDYVPICTDHSVASFVSHDWFLQPQLQVTGSKIAKVKNPPTNGPRSTTKKTPVLTPPSSMALAPGKKSVPWEAWGVPVIVVGVFILAMIIWGATKKKKRT